MIDGDDDIEPYWIRRSLPKLLTKCVHLVHPNIKGNGHHAKTVTNEKHDNHGRQHLRISPLFLHLIFVVIIHFGSVGTVLPGTLHTVIVLSEFVENGQITDDQYKKGYNDSGKKLGPGK